MNIFSDNSLDVTEIKVKINQWDLIKLTNFCMAKENKKKTKRQFTESEKLVSKDETDKGLISKIFRQLLQLNNDNKTQSKNVQKTHIDISLKKTCGGVPFVAQWVKNLCSLHKSVGSIPGLAQWVKDLALP